MIPIRILLTIFFGDYTPRQVIQSALYIAGLWGIFVKSGLKGWWSLIPCAREYQLSRCAGLEQEGRVYSVVTFFCLITELTAFLFHGEMVAYVFVYVLLTMELVRIIYGLRVYNGLIDVYGLKKRWVWLSATAQ